MDSRRSFLAALAGTTAQAATVEAKAPTPDRKQTFVRGDVVRVARPAEDETTHYHEGLGELAIVCGSYTDQYGPGHEHVREGKCDCYTCSTYTLFFPELRGQPYNSSISWFNEEQLEFVEARSLRTLDLLDYRTK